MRGTVRHIAGDRGEFRHDIGIGNKVGQHDLPRCVRRVLPVGRNAPARVGNILAGGIGDGEGHARERRARDRVLFRDRQASLGLVAELKRNRFAALDLDGLRRIVEDIAGLRPRFLDDQRHAGVNAVNADAARAVGNVLPVGVADQRTRAVGDEKFHIGQGRSRQRVLLGDKDAALRGITEVELNDRLRVAGEIRRLRRCVDHMAAVARQLLHHIRARFKPGHGERAVGAGFLGGDHGAARAGRAGQVLDLENRALHSFAGHAVEFIDDKRGERRIFKGDGLSRSRQQIELLRVGGFERVTGRRLDLLYLVPSVTEVIEPEPSVFVRVVIAEVVDLAAERLIAAVGDAELRALYAVAGDAVDLVDRQIRLEVVFKNDGAQLIRLQRNKLLRFLCGEVAGRRGGLGNLIHAGVKVTDEDFAVCVRRFRGDGGGIGLLDLEHRAAQSLARVRVALDDFQVRFFLIGYDELAGLPREQLHMELCFVLNVPAGRGKLLHGIDAGIKVFNRDLAAHIGDAVKIMAPVLNLRHAEGRAGQQLTPLGIVLDNGERRFFRVRECENRVFAALDLDDALGIVNEVIFRRCQLLDRIAAGVERGQVDLAIGVGHVLLAEAAAHLRDFEAGVCQRRVGLTVQLCEENAGFQIVKENKGLILRARFQLDLLRDAVDHMTCQRGNLFDEVGAGVKVIKENLTAGIGRVFSNQRRVAVDGKGRVGKALLRLRVVFHDAELGHTAVFHGDAGVVGGRGVVVIDVNAMLRAVQNVTGRSNGFFDGVVARRDAGDVGKAVFVGGHAGDALTVPEYVKARVRQAVIVAFVTFVNDERGLADILESHCHVALAVPMDGLRRCVQLIALRGRDLIHLVAAHGELVGVHLDDARGVGVAGGRKAAVDLLKAHGRALQGVARLRVHLFHGELLLGAVLHGQVIHTRRLDADAHGIDDGIARRGLGFGQRVGDQRFKQVPCDNAVFVGGAHAGAAVCAGQGKLCAGKYLPAAAYLCHLQLAGFCQDAAPHQDSFGALDALAGVGNDIALLRGVVVFGEVDFILHHVRAAADRDLAAVGNGLSRDAELRPAGVFKAVAVEGGVLVRNRQTPCCVTPERAARKLVVLQIGEHRALRRVVVPQLDVVAGVVGRGRGRKGIFAGVVRNAADHLALDAVTLAVRGVFQRHVGGHGDVAAQRILVQTDIHTRLRDARPALCHVEDELDCAENAHLLGVAGRLRDELAPACELRPRNAELSQRRPNRKLRRVGVFAFGQPGQDGVSGEVQAEERINAVGGIAVGQRPRRLRACRVLSRNRECAGGIVQPMIDTERGSACAVVGRIGVRPRAQLRAEIRGQIELTGAERDGTACAAVRN